MSLFLKLSLLALSCYLGGIYVFQRDGSQPQEASLSGRQVTKSKLPRNHPLRQFGASQIENTLAFAEQLDTAEGCQTFASQLNADPKNRHSSSLWSIILARWSQIDPPGMIAFLSAEKAANRPTEMEALAWQAWGASDPENAVEHVNRIDQKLTKALFKGIAQTNPDLAVQFAFKAPDTDKLLYTVLKNGDAFSDDTVSHLTQFFNFGWAEIGLRKLLLEREHSGDPEKDQATFLKYARQSYGGDDPFLVSYSKENPAQAAALHAKEPASLDRAVSKVEIAQNWALVDPDASLDWARQEESPQIRNTALVAIASAIGGDDPLRGLSLIEEINWADTKILRDIKGVSDETSIHSGIIYPDLHNTTNITTSLFRNLNTIDPIAARRYLEEKVPAKFHASFEEILEN